MQSHISSVSKHDGGGGVGEAEGGGEGEAEGGGEGEAEGGGDGFGDGGGDSGGETSISSQHEEDAEHVEPAVSAQHLTSHLTFSLNPSSHLHWLEASSTTHVGGAGGGEAEGGGEGEAEGGGEGEAEGGGEGEAEGGGEGEAEGGGGDGPAVCSWQHESEPGMVAGHVAPTVAAQHLASHGFLSTSLPSHLHWLVGSLGTQISGGGGAGGGIGGGEGLSCPLAVVARSIGSHCGEQATPWTTEACVFDPSAEVWVSMVPRTARVRKLMALRAVCCATEADEVEGV